MDFMANFNTHLDRSHVLQAFNNRFENSKMLYRLLSSSSKIKSKKVETKIIPL